MGQVEDGALNAFLRANFDWTSSLRGVWHDSPVDVPAVHQSVFGSILDAYGRLEEQDPTDDNPLGFLVVGQAGAGKTHLLGRLRREITARGGTFLFLDLTDVRDFWETALQGAVFSLTRRLRAGETQLRWVLDALLARFADGPLAGCTAAQLGEVRPPALSNRIDRLLESLARGDDRHAAARHDPVLRALLLLGSSDPRLLTLGEAWLSGLDVREELQLVFGLPDRPVGARERLAGLGYAAQFRGPLVVAVDQLDAIASEARAAAEAGVASGAGRLFQHAAHGLMALWEALPRSLVVVSCLETTHQWLEKNAMASVRHRFRENLTLRAVNAEPLEALLARRLAVAYAKSGFEPPYPTYPFLPGWVGNEPTTPRELLRRAEAHRLRCQAEGRVLETKGDRHPGPVAPPTDFEHLDREFEALRAQVDPEAKLRGADPELDKLLETACRALAAEHTKDEGLDVELDLDFAHASAIEPLHARIRVIDHRDRDRERHLSLRFIQHDHPIAFQTRLKKAMTESGIGAELPFRRLLVHRSEPVPSGPKTQVLLAELHQKNGQLEKPTLDEVRTLTALLRWFELRQGGLHAWLGSRKPVSRLPSIAPHVDFLFGPGQPSVDGLRPEPPRLDIDTGEDAPKPPPPEALLIGETAAGLRPEPVEIQPLDLCSHVAVLGGAGSGKTMMLRRIVELAALRGIPSLVFDVGGDLARLGERWPSPPEGWDPGAQADADRYFAQTEVVLWTPGVVGGNPVSLSAVPDFRSLTDDPDERLAAIDMAAALLAADLPVAPRETVKGAVLRAAIERLAAEGAHRLEDLAAVLQDPARFASQYEKGERLASQLRDQVLALLQRDQGALSGPPLDLDVLFGVREEKTRISVLSLTGVPSLERQTAIVGRVMTQLFAYARARPRPSGRPAGLVVLDEAKDFAPSGRPTAATQPLIRAFAQLRKYGYGLLLGTQEPKSVEHQIIANCTTQLFGKFLSPAAQDAARKMMENRGAGSVRLGDLPAGVFYAATGAGPPRKMRGRLSLSHHGPALPPEEAKQRAAGDRRRLEQDGGR